MKVLSIIFIILGVLLLLTGAMFKIMHWPDMFKGIYSGPIMIIAGAVLLIVYFSRSKNN